MIDIDCPECHHLGPHPVVDDDDPHVNVRCDMCGFRFTVRMDGKTK